MHQALTWEEVRELEEGYSQRTTVVKTAPVSESCINCVEIKLPDSYAVGDQCWFEGGTVLNGDTPTVEFPEGPLEVTNRRTAFVVCRNLTEDPVDELLTKGLEVCGVRPMSVEDHCLVDLYSVESIPAPVGSAFPDPPEKPKTKANRVDTIDQPRAATSRADARIGVSRYLPPTPKSGSPVPRQPRGEKRV